MAQHLMSLGGRRCHETSGHGDQEFEIRDRSEHRAGRTIGEADSIWCTLLTMNTHPPHCQETYAQAARYGRCLVPNLPTVAMLVGMCGNDVRQKVMTNLGRWEHPLRSSVHCGDTRYAESAVLETRESRSGPAAGLVTVRTVGRNQTVLCTLVRTIVVAGGGTASKIASTTDPAAHGARRPSAMNLTDDEMPILEAIARRTA